MVRNWQLHCRDFENLDFAKFLADSSVPLGDFENLDDIDSKYSKNPYIRTLNFEGQAAVGSYLMIVNSNMLGS